MKEKTQIEKNAANRQVELLTTALEKSKENGGVWLNADRKPKPMLHRKEIGISGFNGLTLALASDQYHYGTNLYTSYMDSRNHNGSVRDHERGVPFNWYNWNKLVNKDDPRDIISREDYKKLPAEEQKQYKAIRQREIRWLFNVDQTIIPQAYPERYDELVAKYGNGEVRNLLNYDEDKDLRAAVNDFQSKMNDNLVKIYDDAALGYYDAETDSIHVTKNEHLYEDYPDFVQSMVFPVVAATGHKQRLAREGMAGPVEVVGENAKKRERLIRELVTGVKMQELGMPARLSRPSRDMVDFWVRELKEDPKLIDIVERDVNNALNMIHRAERGEKIELKNEVNTQQTEDYKALLPKRYFIADEIKLHPDKDDKLFVVVKDVDGNTADVILPQGASVERDNEIPGMNKDRIKHALAQQGYTDVYFFNPDGALGYRPDDSYFAGKEVSVSKLKNWDMTEISMIDVSEAVEKAKPMVFKRVQMVQDNDNNWALFLEPKGKEPFTVYPEKEDINRFFTMIKKPVSVFYEFRDDIANKYYALAEAKPELKVNIFDKEEDVPEADLNRIKSALIFSTKDGGHICSATIDGAQNLHPRKVTPQQWQRFFLSDDWEGYKKRLAARLFADVLKKTRPVEQSQEQKQETVKEDTREKVPLNWEDLKAKHPTAMLMFRIGDNYQMYKEDALKGKEILGTDVQKIRNDVDMTAFPHAKLDTYLPKLIRSGCRVAICDPLPERKTEESEKVKQEQAVGKEESRSRGMRR